MKKLNCTVIGYGRIGERHSKIIEAHPDLHLSAIIEIDKDKEELIRRQYNCDHFNSIEEIKKSEDDNDLFVVCTPNGLHSDHCEQALIKNYNVLCEKPFGIDPLHCRKIVDLASRSEKQVYCVMQNRYSPPALWLKEIIDSNKIGKVYQIVVNCFWNRNESYYKDSDWKGTKKLDGGILFTQFSHFVDTVFWLFGHIRITFASTYHQKMDQIIEIEDAGLFSFETSENAFGTFNYSINHHDQNLESSITVIGEKGSIKVGGQYMDKIVYCNIPDYEIPELKAINPPNNYGDYKGSAANHIYVYENIIDHFNNKKAAIVSAREGLKIVEIIDQVYNYK